MATSADEIFKEFKEHSISEFFRKNSQMLGYAGKVRSLTTIVHEYVTNSVTYDTPTVVKIDGRISIVKIGEMVNYLMSLNNDDISRGSDTESLRGISNMMALCFDKNTLKLGFKPISSMHRHKLEAGEPIFNIKITGGSCVEITKHHSLFTIKDGRVLPVKAEEITKGSYIVVPSKGWANEEDAIKSVNLLEELLALPPEITEKIGIYGVKEILYADKELKNKIKSQLSKKDRHYKFYAYYMSCDRLPVNLLRVLKTEERTVFHQCKVGFRKGTATLDNYLKIDEDLARFFGIFTAEGSVRSNMRGIAISFGNTEIDLIEFTEALIKKIFGLSASIRKAHPTAVNITIQNSIVAFIMKYVFGYRHSAKDKIVPNFVFNLGRDKIEQFLLGYLCGDGYPTRTIFELMVASRHLSDLDMKVTAVTASKSLATGVCYLLSALGRSYSLQTKLSQERIIKGRTGHFGKSYRIDLWPRQRYSPTKYYPIKEGGITEIVDSGIKWGIAARNQRTILIEKIERLSEKAKINDNGKKFLDGDLGLAIVSDISVREPHENEYVYDYSIKDDENFVGGAGAICLHNSIDACEEAGILPEISIEIKETGENRYSIKATDNGPGIPQGHIGKALASILAGTKFHRYMQQRGQQGIGAAGCTLFAKITTGKPIHARSGTGKRTFECDITIDIKTNKPLITNLVELQTEFRGLEVSGEFGEVKYEQSDHGVLEYLRRTALSNPHCNIRLLDPDGKEANFPRSVEAMPKRPRQIKPHPLGLSTNDLVEFAHKAMSSRKVSSFMIETFSRVTQNKIDELKAIATDVNFDKNPAELTWDEAEKIVKAVRQTKWIAPDLDSLSTIGEKQVEAAIKNILNPTFLAVVERKPRVFRGGIPFVVEAGIAYGGSAGKAGAQGSEGNILRFGNKVPLLFDSSVCAITEAVRGIDWKRYAIQKFEEEPVSVMVNVSSVYIPYSGVGKQAISQEDEIIEEIRLAVQEAGRDMQRYLHGVRTRSVQESRYKTIMRYVDQLSADLSEITGEKKETIEARLKALIEGRYKKLFDTPATKEELSNGKVAQEAASESDD